MKKLIFILLACLSAPVLHAQDNTAVQWKVALQQIDSSHYVVHATATPLKGWYVYGANKVNEVEGVAFSWSNENVVADGKVESDVQPVLIKDKIFNTTVSAFEGTVIFSQQVKLNGKIPSFKLNVTGFAGNGAEFLPIDYSNIITLNENTPSNTGNQILLAGVDVAHPVADCGKTIERDKGLLGIFFLGVVGGLIALITPCVFPMIPVTVSFFTNKKEIKGTRNAILYGLFIFLIYISASVPFHLIGNIDPQIFNTISTSVVVNLIFFVVFIAFALSFFGVFELTLPSSIANKADSKAGLHVGGIFFMALTLAIVSFSCTGPILGSLLVSSISSDKGAWQLTAGMGGFGFALALPFALFALFPHWMNKLPKSGGWLSTVKKTLAFVELGLTLKFLSNADLVKHWGLLKRETFIGLWIVIASLLALYLLGVIKLGKHKENIGNARMMAGAFVLLFALYLTPGLTQTKYANLKLLSGFPPPLSYSIYGKDNVLNKGVEPDVINDYAAALAMSRQQHKPILIDFTGWACVNCRKMEEQVWTKPEVAALIKEKFILVSLYVDDRKTLPAEQQFVYEGKEVKTTGDLYALMESVNFKQATQPLYAIIGEDGKLMNWPVGYTPDATKYAAWLECGGK